MNPLADLAAQLARVGGPALGSLLGTAIGGPVGATVGGVAGQVLTELGRALGTPPEPEAIAEKIAADPDMARMAIREVEARAAAIMAEAARIEAQRAADNDRVEAERGFGAWQMRRTITHYAVLLILIASFGAALAGALGLVTADLALLGALVGHATLIFMSWNGLVSGGRAVKDAVLAYRSGAR